MVALKIIRVHEKYKRLGKKSNTNNKSWCSKLRTPILVKTLTLLSYPKSSDNLSLINKRIQLSVGLTSKAYKTDVNFAPGLGTEQLYDLG